MDKISERNKTLSAENALASLTGLMGSRVGNGQCYAVPAYYALKATGRPHLCAGVDEACPISDTTGADTVAASNIGYAYRWGDFGWTMIENPSAQDLKVGGIITWKPHRDVAITEYGHVGVIENLDGATIHTIEQNAEAGQVVARYTRTWKPDIFQHIIYIEGEEMPTAAEIAKAVWERPITNMAGVDNLSWIFMQRMDHFIAEQPNRVWAHVIKTFQDKEMPLETLMYHLDKNQDDHYRLMTEMNERTKAITEALAKITDTDLEAMEKKIKESVEKSMEDYRANR